MIKMIIKGRSPTMRHVSRTHRVAADWPFDRIILDPKIQKLNMSSNTKDQVQGNLSRDTTSNKHTQNKTKVPTKRYNYDLNNINCVPSNAKFSRFGAMLYILEDNEAVIKMIIKGRSPTKRHVSRTNRVALDWLF